MHSSYLFHIHHFWAFPQLDFFQVPRTLRGTVPCTSPSSVRRISWWRCWWPWLRRRRWWCWAVVGWRCPWRCWRRAMRDGYMWWNCTQWRRDGELNGGFWCWKWCFCFFLIRGGKWSTNGGFCSPGYGTWTIWWLMIYWSKDRKWWFSISRFNNQRVTPVTDNNWGLIPVVNGGSGEGAIGYSYWDVWSHF